MRDLETNVLEQYDIEIKGIRKTRGAFLCDTDRGMFLLKELTFSEKRVPVLHQLCRQLEESGYELVDTVIPNKEAEYVTAAADQTKYILKRWYGGRECDVKNPEDVCSAVRNLARLHGMLHWNGEEDDAPVQRDTDMREEYARHNRELRKVRSFIRAKVGKGEFERIYLREFDGQHEWAEKVLEQLAGRSYLSLAGKSRREHSLVHGDYNYHNILMTCRGIATTNFEHFRADIQMADLYYFLRKVMEKCQWEEREGERLLAAYDRERKLGGEEMDYLAVRLAYPEKFWKIANIYYHSNKAWIPEKSVEKLQTAVNQTEKKKRFLENVFSFHL